MADQNAPTTRRTGPPPSVVRTGRLGLVQYSRVVAFIAQKPRTAVEVARLMGRGAQSLREILWRLEHMGEAHVVEWRAPEKKRSIMAAVFAAGPGTSVPYPRPMKRPVPGSTLAKNNPKPELIAFCSILRALRHGSTRSELHESTGVAQMRLGILLRHMRGAHQVYRCGWATENDRQGAPAEVLKLGNGRDAPRPPAMSAQEKGQRYRDRRRRRVATERVVNALKGVAPITPYGVQSYHLLGAA